jgi:RNA polymerase sigma factor (sigma-70 family)
MAMNEIPPGHQVFFDAVAAAKDGDVINFLKALHESRFMDGAKRTLQFGWRLDEETSHEILAKSTDKFFVALKDGKKIYSPASYLFKIIKNEAANFLKKASKFEEYDDNKGYKLAQAGNEPEYPMDEDEPDQEERRKKGLEIARSLLPKIGSNNVQEVMKYIIDAIEAGAEDITSREIAEALGLSEVSVRKWRERGFERIKRAAIDAGYHKEYLATLESDTGLKD